MITTAPFDRFTRVDDGTFLGLTTGSGQYRYVVVWSCDAPAPMILRVAYLLPDVSGLDSTGVFGVFFCFSLKFSPVFLVDYPEYKPPPRSPIPAPSYSILVRPSPFVLSLSHHTSARRLCMFQVLSCPWAAR